MKRVKKVIKLWNAEDNGDINKKIRDKEAQLDIIDNSLSASPLQSQVSSELQDLYQEKTAMLIQQSRVKWDVDGDKNSRFFHQVVKFRSNRNSIKAIKDGNVVLSNPEDIRNLFFNHFRNFFRSNGEEIVFNLDNLLVQKLSPSKALWLERKFSKEEIWTALHDCPNLKAPGPDGLNAGWLKSLWNSISGKIEKFFDDFFLHSTVPRGNNSSFFTLVPKNNCPELVSDFRPISLINSSFKILLKVLANRISSVIDLLVSNNQSAFVKGRNISDGILITNEIVKDMQNNLCDGIIIKLDFAKAYDSVNWGFLFHVLMCFGFSEKWISWISSLLSSSRISVLVNGSPMKEFSPQRGLRQGDPLAPYLFILISEVLHVLLELALEKKVFEGATFKDGRKAISHLQYADDTILFIKADLPSILGVKKVLLLFQAMSGLSINFNKSQIFDANNEVVRLEPWALALGCQIGKIPFTYLGASIGKNITSKSFWDPLISHFKKRLAQWKSDALNFAGKVVLIRSCLDALPNYWMNLYKIPRMVIKELDRIKRTFLWKKSGNDQGSKAIHLLSWDRLCEEKSSGGLGISNIDKRNSAFLSKWCWRFLTDRDKLWWTFIHAKYGPILNNYPTRNCSKLSPVMQSIVDVAKSSPLLHPKSFRWKVGNGLTINFWTDYWWQDNTMASLFPRLYLLANDKEIKLSTFSQWLLNSEVIPTTLWRRPLRGWELNSLAVLRSVLIQTHFTEVSDKVVWLINNSSFLVKDMYRKLNESSQGSIDWNSLWKIKVPGRIKVFLWKIAKNILPTKSLIYKRTGIGNEFCLACNTDHETVDHIFWKCSEVKDIWKEFLHWWDIPISSVHLYQVFNFWSILKLNTNVKLQKVWKISIAALLWSIWLNRNGVIFNNKTIPKSSILLLVKSRSRSWASNAQLLSKVDDNLWNCDPSAAIHHMFSKSWHLFLDEFLGHYKYIAFVDGAWNGNSNNPTTGGIGGIILNQNKDLEFIFSGPRSCSSPLDAEMGALQFLCESIRLKVDSSRFLICMDSSIMFKDVQIMQADLVHKSNLNWGHSTWFFHSLNVQFKWINRELNFLADNLAKEGAKRTNLISGWV